MKRVIISLLFLATLKLCAQSSSPDGSKQKLSTQDVFDLMWSTQHISFGVFLTGCQRADLVKRSGKYEMSSSAQLGYEVRFNYYYNLDSKWSLLTGLYIGVYGRNYLLTIPKNDIDPSLDENYIDNGAATRSKDIFYISLPLGLQKKWWNDQKNRSWLAYIGTNINWPLSNQPDQFTEQLYIPGQGPTQILAMDISLNHNSKPWVTLETGTGYQWILFNKNMIAANIHLSVSFVKVANGIYHITVPNQPDSDGDYSVSTTNIGLGINYIFTGTRKKLHQLSNK